LTFHRLSEGSTGLLIVLYSRDRPQSREEGDSHRNPQSSRQLCRCRHRRAGLPFTMGAESNILILSIPGGDGMSTGSAGDGIFSSLRCSSSAGWPCWSVWATAPSWSAAGQYRHRLVPQHRRPLPPPPLPRRGHRLCQDQQGRVLHQQCQRLTFPRLSEGSTGLLIVLYSRDRPQSRGEKSPAVPLLGSWTRLRPAGWKAGRSLREKTHD